MSGNVRLPVDDHKDACAHCKGLLQTGQRVCEKCFAELNAKRKTYSFFVLIWLLLAFIQLGYVGYRATKCPDCKKHEAIYSFHSPGPPICAGNGACIKRCVHCKHVPVDAVQTENGEILCKICFDEIVDYPNRLCPDCNVAVEPDKYFIDKAVRREVSSYRAKCIWKEWGCTWIGTPRECEAHQQECRFMKLPPCCHNGCDASFPMALLDEHKVKCRFRPVRCPECQCEVPFYQLTKHYQGQCKAARSACVPSAPVENEGSEIAPTVEARRMECDNSIRTLHPAKINLNGKDRHCDQPPGTLLWTIGNFSKKLQEAIEKHATFIESPIFYTGRHGHGYQMCLRVYLNGFEEGFNTHISIHFVIMEGQYDHLLKWPFDYIVSLIITDQHRNITEEFGLKHEREVSDAIRVNKFVEVDRLINEGYVKEDQLFIKCIVHT